MLPRPFSAVLVAAGVAVVLSGGTAAAAPTSASTPVTAAAPAVQPGAAQPGAAQPGAAELARKQAEAARRLAAKRAEAAKLQAELDEQERAMTEARQRVDAFAARAGAALEAHQVAVRQRDAALDERDLQTARLAEARRVLAASRADLGRWASQAYRDGAAMSDYEELMTLVDAESSDDLGRRMALLGVVGRVKGEVVVTVDNAAQVQREATVKARAAAVEAQAAAERAEAARARADALLASQREQLAVLDDLLADTQDAAASADAEAAQLAAARQVAEARRLAALAATPDATAAANLVTGVVGACAGEDLSRYANGAIPSAALCELWGAPGHLLRADAAHAFDQLSRAYAKHFGEPICVTDSYRTLASQVRLRAEKPTLAAAPGTSNHGWATATDLCGGIETFGSEAHLWMRANAPLFGWFHPGWAQADGNKPEPWHWEFGD